MRNKITSDDHGGAFPREKGSTANQGHFVQPTVTNSQECGFRSLAKDTNAL